MSYSNINKSSDFFKAVLYTGNSSTQNVDVGFASDWQWIKSRTTTQGHTIYDNVRGQFKVINSHVNNGEATETGGFTGMSGNNMQFNGDNAVRGDTNYSGTNYVAWNWKAGTTGSGTTTGLGTGKAYSYSVNTAAGFSIIKYVGNGTGGHTIPHHLGNVTPEFIIVKNLDSSIDWRTFHKDVPDANTRAIKLNSSDYWNTDSSWWNNTSPSSSVFTVGSSTSMNGDGTNYIAYCFASKVGYQKIGAYEGNGSNSTPPFIYTGFKPSFVIMRKRDASDHWYIIDNKRVGYNPNNYGLYPNLSNVEYSGTAYHINLYSNGFSPVTTDGMMNGNGDAYIYYAVGQSLVGSNNVPCTAG